MHNLLMIFGFLFLLIGVPVSTITTIVFAAKKKKIKRPLVCIPLFLVLSFALLAIGGNMYSKTDEYKEYAAQKEEEKKLEEKKRVVESKEREKKEEDAKKKEEEAKIELELKKKEEEEKQKEEEKEKKRKKQKIKESKEKKRAATEKPKDNERPENGDAEKEETGIADGIERISSGEYLFVTGEDLDKYCANMEGAKVYLVTDVDDMKDGVIQSTLSGGFMMSNFDVGANYPKYESVLKEGDLIGVSGTVSGHDGYSFMGTSVNLEDCQVFAVGEAAKAYQKEVSDPGLSGYFTVTEEVADANNDDVPEGDYKALCQILDYEDVLRNPDANEGKYCIVSGTVDQIIEGWFGSFTIFVNDANGNTWGCVYSYKEGEAHLLEGDGVTMYGKCAGTDTNTTLLGKQVTLPRVDVEYIN